MSPADPVREGATVVITHRVCEGREADYERWLGEIGPVSRSSPGHLDWQLVRPVPGLTTTYTAIIRFDTDAHLRQWMESAQRLRFIEQVRPLLVAGENYTVRSGLDFLFSPAEAGTKVPVRWKQFLVTWSAIFPLVLVVPLVVRPLLRVLGLPDDRSLATLVATGATVLLMVYVVMPPYTKLVRRWLFK